MGIHREVEFEGSLSKVMPREGKRPEGYLPIMANFMKMWKGSI